MHAVPTPDHFNYNTSSVHPSLSSFFVNNYTLPTIEPPMALKEDNALMPSLSGLVLKQNAKDKSNIETLATILDLATNTFHLSPTEIVSMFSGSDVNKLMEDDGKFNDYSDIEKNTASSSPTKSVRSNRPRQYNIRLKLPIELCLSAVQGLIRVLCTPAFRMPLIGNVIVCKVIARLCSNGSSQTIPLICAVEENLDELLLLGIKPSSESLLKHAILCLILDVVEAESRSLVKKSNLNTSLSKTALNETGETPLSFAEKLSVELTGVSLYVLTKRANERISKQKKLPAFKSDGSTALKCGLISPFCFFKPSAGFSIANYDCFPNNGERENSLIYRGFDLVGIIKGSVTRLSDEFRRKTLRSVFYEAFKRHSSYAGNFSDFFLCLDRARSIELETALVSYNSDVYELKLRSHEEWKHFTLNKNQSFSLSAITACLNHEYHLMNGKTVTFKDLLMKEDENIVGCTEDSASQSFVNDDVAVDDNSDAQSARYKQPTEALNATFIADVHSSEISSEIDTAENKPDEVVAETYSSSKNEASSSKIMLNKQKILNYSTISFLADMRLLTADVMMHPCLSLTSDDTEKQLGYNIHMCSMSLNSLADVVSRDLIRRLIHVRRPALHRIRLPENLLVKKNLGVTLHVVRDTIHKFLKELSLGAPPNFIQNVVTFASDFRAGVETVAKRLTLISLVDQLSIKMDGLIPLIDNIVAYNLFSAENYVSLMKFIYAEIRDNKPLVICLVKLPYFDDFIKQCFLQSIHRLPFVEEVEPVSSTLLRNFISCVHMNYELTNVQHTDELCIKMLIALRKLFLDWQISKKCHGAVDISCINSFLSTYLDYYVQVEVHDLADFVFGAIVFIRYYFEYQIGKTRFMMKDLSQINATEDYSPYAFAQNKTTIENMGDEKFEGAELCFDFNKHTNRLRSGKNDRTKNCSDPLALFLQNIYKLLDQRGDMAKVLVDMYPTAVLQLFEILSMSSVHGRLGRPLSSYEYTPSTVSDYCFELLMKIYEKVENNPKNFIRLLIRRLKEYSEDNGKRVCDEYVLTKPIPILVIQLLSKPSMQKVFMELDGHIYIVSEIERSLQLYTSKISHSIFAPLVERLASVSYQLATNNDIYLPKRYDWKSNRLQNLAPLCTISSPNIFSQQLSHLLMVPPSHRRARTANWSHHFQSNEQWIVIIVNLPYQVFLHEVQIRFHSAALNTAPSFVQLEISADMTGNWKLCGPIVPTGGLDKLRFNIFVCQQPVHAVRFYLQRPFATSSICLSQILLLGTNFSHVYGKRCFIETDFVNWIVALNKLSEVKNHSIWTYSPHLPRRLVSLFLAQPLYPILYDNLMNFFVKIDDNEAQNEHIVEYIMHYIYNGNRVDKLSLGCLPDCLFLLCTLKSKELKKLPVHRLHHFCVLRQRHLLTSIIPFIKKDHFMKISQDAMEIILWTTACIVWHNAHTEEMHYDTVAIASQILEKYLPILLRFVIAEPNSLMDSMLWLLCALFTAAPSFLSEAFVLLNILDDSKQPLLPAKHKFLNIVGKICQSSAAIRELSKYGLLDFWIHSASKICSEEENIESTDLLISLLECLSSLSHINIVVERLDGSLGNELFEQLINFTARYMKGYLGGDKKRVIPRFENALVELINRCLSSCSNQRERISTIISSALKNQLNLDSSLKQLILRCILVDEAIQVRITNEVTNSLNDFTCSRIKHPVFGCQRQDNIYYVSLYTPSKYFILTHDQQSVERNEEVGADTEIFDYWETNQSAAAKQQKLLKSSSHLASDDKICRLICNAYNPNKLLPDNWTINNIIDVVRSQKSNRICDQTSSEKNDWSAYEPSTDYTDGYFALILTLKEIKDLDYELNEDACTDETFVSFMPQISTIQCFAKAGGIAALAESDASSVRNSLNMDHRRRFAPYSFDSAVFYNNLMMQNEKMDDDLVPKAPWTLFYDTDGSISLEPGLDYSDPQFSPTLPEVSEKFKGIMKNYGEKPPHVPVANDHLWFPTPITSSVKKRKVVPDSFPFLHSPDLPPHVLVIFNILLRLDKYSELLVTIDRHRAKRLLRHLMGVNTDSWKYEAQGSIITSGEKDSLSLFPFVILQKLFEAHPPDTISGMVIREASLNYGVIDIVLVCLGHYSHHKYKVGFQRPKNLPPLPDSVKLIPRLLQLSCHLDRANLNNFFDERAMQLNQNQQHQNFWAKGTGFGSGTTQQQWNVNLHVMKRKCEEEAVTCIFKVLTSFIHPFGLRNRGHRRSRRTTCSLDHVPNQPLLSPPAQAKHSPCSSARSAPSSDIIISTENEFDWLLPVEIVELLSQSCLLPTIYAYLRNDSVLDISRHVEVYKAVVQFIATFALAKTLSSEDDHDMITEILSRKECDGSILTMLNSLNTCITTYLDGLSKFSNQRKNQNCEDEQERIVELDAKCSEESLSKLSSMISIVHSILSKRIKEEPQNAESHGSEVHSERNYTDIMKHLQFGTVSFFASERPIRYHFNYAISSVSMTSGSSGRMRRLAQETMTISKSLPLSASSAAFVRCCEERIDAMKVLITGPADTPYMNGCFEFDVWFPPDYPNLPMQINLETTGNHTVRFNPNLYNDGKVCLSILNTWHGRPEERWSPETSSLLQVIVSIQSLILVAEPYFNEPGYERTKCTQGGQQASREYDANVKQATVRWAMLEMIRHPPAAFTDVIRKHFWLKRHEISAQVASWIIEIESQATGSNRQLSLHLASLRRNAAALEEEFVRMECPEDLCAAVHTISETNQIAMIDAKPGVHHESDGSSKHLMEVLKL